MKYGYFNIDNNFYFGIVFWKLCEYVNLSHSDEVWINENRLR